MSFGSVSLACERILSRFSMDPLPAADRRRIALRAVSIALATTPFGLTFGAIAASFGLSLLETMGFSLFVFTGSAQFAAVAILGEGGAVGAAVSAGLLLNLRSLAFGILLAPTCEDRSGGGPSSLTS